MKKYKIYKTKYSLTETSLTPPDAYALNGELTDDVPNAKKLGYAIMEDGSIIECYKKFKPQVLVLPSLLVVAAVGSLAYYILCVQTKDVEISGIPIKVGEDKNVVSYNGFMSLDKDNITVNFQNGDQESIIYVEGEGIECKPYTVAPGEYVATIPAKFTTEANLVEGKLNIETNTSSIEEEVVIEIPNNDNTTTPNTELDGYWKGEYIYGITN